MNKIVNSQLNSIISNDTKINDVKNKQQVGKKENIKGSLPNLNSISEQDKTLELGIKQIVNKLLDSIKTSKDLNQTLQEAKQLQISKNINKDLQELKQILTNQKDEKLKAIIQKIDNLLSTNIKDTKGLINSINNSGIFFESKLRTFLNEEKLPKSFFRLISNIKNIQNTNLKNLVFSLSNEKMDAKSSLLKLDELVKNINTKELTQSINSSSSVKTIQFLQNAKQFIQKNPSAKNVLIAAAKINDFLDKNTIKLIAENQNIENSKDILNRFSQLKQSVSELNTQANNIIFNKLTMPSNKINLNNIQENIKSLLKQENINSNDIKALEKISPELNKMQEELPSSTTILNNTLLRQSVQINENFENTLNNENLNLQNKIENLTRLLSANFKNEESFKNLLIHSEVKHLKHAVNKAKLDIKNIQMQNQNDIKESIQSDAKAILLQSKEIAQNTNNQALLNLSQKMLTQIQINQLISVASQEVLTNLPYLLEDLEDSSLSFKADKEDKFYAQIKLNFKNLGKLNVLLALYNEKYLDINMMVENDSFRQKLIANAKEFKASLKNSDLISANFFIGKLQNIEYETNYRLDVGLDKKV
ncbi:flagellar hook-length control protein FliK [Campylobacter canadensis]|uniref:Flagellar hook-length control protein FliK n=1 Tax=Campylobacter canadensis TaxID=449520 RepID=A0ABS7WQU2_9BACT|nr:flagellar hook-length control protein FliK [Campylobacter canadensis]MBZ7987137.1 flagellar hook-length control protein FliK [Campylobacter canadensis]MBZ7994509.1 flagellar hook-length control protein FliK [Campylobacter canadensis]MBZ7997196.1 flagellar hook-length control protein FliK [Campylobacter canadensis]MBZ7998239.1 flagellar hook-length control protein FliK [Campylobacter canadensis]MBZ7999776.1 flagellar hook-length control protein FliK [Campylobacter canadensis]